jgi:hypothetical protein
MCCHTLACIYTAHFPTWDPLAWLGGTLTASREVAWASHMACQEFCPEAGHRSRLWGMVRVSGMPRRAPCKDSCRRTRCVPQERPQLRVRVHHHRVPEAVQAQGGFRAAGTCDRLCSVMGRLHCKHTLHTCYSWTARCSASSLPCLPAGLSTQPHRAYMLVISVQPHVNELLAYAVRLLSLGAHSGTCIALHSRKRMNASGCLS